MDLPRSDMQRRALRALVTLCLVFFAGAILVLTSFATPALADENSYNSENIASAGAGSNGSVVVMAPAAAPQPVAASSSAAEPVAAPRSAAAAIPMPASAGSAAVTTPAAAPKAAPEAVALPAESARTESAPEQTAPAENAAPTETSGEVYGPVRDLFKPDESSSGLDGVDQIMQDALDSPLLAASSSISPQADNSGFFASNSNISWTVDTRTMTLNIHPVLDNGDMTVTEYGSSLPWKSSFTTTDIFQVIITGPIAPRNLSNWFSGYTSLVSFQADSLNTSNVTTFANMFNGCTNLETVQGIGSWNTSKATTFMNMFVGCSNLKELDFTNWTVGSATKTNMLSNMGAIEKITLNPNVNLNGTGLGNTASRGDNAGTWKSDAWSGTTANLVSRYSGSGAPSGIHAYNFYYESSFASNANVLWSFDKTSSTLTIDATGAVDKSVDETAEQLPWLPSVGAAAIKAITTLGNIAPTTLASWFANYANLISFDGTGIDVSHCTSFDSLFRGDTFLSAIDISGWNMDAVASAPRDNMFTNCTTLTTLTVTETVILTGTGLTDSFSKREPKAGTWDCSDGVWFGTTGNLATRYSATKTAAQRPSSASGALIYTWHPNQIGGRFENDNAWWMFSGTSDGILTIGADSVDSRGNAIGAADKKVTESATNVPWLTTGAVPTGSFAVRSVVTRNGIAPVNFENWFKSYVSMTNFDGTGMNVEFATSFAFLFMDAGVTSMNLTGWVMQPTAPRDNMFSGNSSLRRLLLSGDVILTGSGIETLIEHGTANGSWATEDSAWFGSSENLAARYPVSSSIEGDATGSFTYIWDPSMRSGRFDGNDSVYWIYTNGTITIGADPGATNTIVTQDASNLPWNGVIRKDQVNYVVFRATGDASNPTRVKPQNLGGNGTVTDGWFAGYASLVSFNGAGIDLSETHSLANLFKDCNALNSLSGVAAWNTSTITSLEGLFDGCNLMTVQPTIGDWDTSHVTNFAHMFRNTKDLVTIDALARWNVTAAQTFEGMFEGDNFVVTLDISGWNMPQSAVRTNMFAYLEAIATFKICQTVILEGTGLDDAELMKTRIASAGSWDCSDGIWFGTTENLKNRYAGNSIVPGAMTYTWSSNNLRGRFDSNDNAWWKFDRTAGALTLGTDEYKGTGPNPNSAVINRSVTENAANVPWLKAIGENYAVLINMVTVEADGNPGKNFNPVDFAAWFKNYHRLTSFDGAGLDLAGNTSLYQLFYSTERLSTVTGLENWDVSHIESFVSMFEGAASLTQLSGVSGWNTASLTNTNGMFRNASSLLMFVDGASWNVTGVTDFANMFAGCANLVTLDISGWSMDASSTRTDMFASCGKLGTIAAFGQGVFTVGAGVILEGTSFNSDLQGLKVTQGSWEGTPNGASSSTWFGSTSNFAKRYPAGKNAEGAAAGKMAYIWKAGVMAGRFDNDNTWWTFADGVLTIGSDNQAGNLVVTETETGAASKVLPWLAAIGSKDVVTRVVTSTDKRVAPANLNFWFANYPNLVDFNGVGFITTNTISIEGLFEGDAKLRTITGIDEWDTANITKYDTAFKNNSALTSLDISGWNMKDTATRAEMLVGLNALTSITVGPQIIFEGTGFDDTLAAHLPTNGSWAYTSAGSPWFGSTGDVARRYPAAKDGVGNLITDDITYTWSSALRGRFPSNDNAWWSYDANSHTLTLGTDSGSNKIVTEFETSATSRVLPWHKAGIIRAHTTGSNNTWTGRYVTSIIINGRLAPMNLAFWFAGYTDVTNINASGMDISQVLLSPTGTLSSTFAGDTALATLNLTGWNWTASTPHDLMLANLPSISSITLDRVAVLEGTGFGNGADGVTPLSSRVTTAGHWTMDSNSADTPWFDCTQQLIARYGADKSATFNFGAESGVTKTLTQIISTTHTYTWASGVRGRFPSNLYAWWTFVNGVLTIGVEQNAPDKTVSEYDGTMQYMLADGTLAPTSSLTLPWLAPINGKTKITSVATQNSIAPLNMTGWFAGLSNLKTFDGTGLNPAYCTSLHKLFYNDVNLTTINNITDWGVSRVTDFAYSFSELRSLTTLTAIAGWTVNAARTFEGMFANDVRLSRLHLAVDDSHWFMPSDAIFTDMFKNLQDLIYLKVSNGVVLNGPAKDSGFDNTLADHLPKNGTWAELVDEEHEYENLADSLIGNTGDLAARYPETHNNYYTVTYKFLEGYMRGRFENTNVWWEYNKGQLSVGVDDPTLSVEVTEFEAADGSVTMPWRSLIEDPNNDPDTRVTSFVSSPELGTISPHTLESWFKGYTQLTKFDGRGLDLSLVTSMESTFDGCTALVSVTWPTDSATTEKLISLRNLYNGAINMTSVTGMGEWNTINVTSFDNAFAGLGKITELDIHSWVMENGTHANLLQNCKGLRKLILGQGVRLGDSGLSNSLPGLEATTGMWLYTNDEGDEIWFDCTSRLADRYSGNDQGRAPPAGTITYIWDDTRLGGRFMSNQNAWWYYVKATKALHMGADGGADADKSINEADSTAANLPWRKVVANYTTSILTVHTTGGLAPKSLGGWFDGHTGLTNFDGAGLDTKDVTSFASTFRNDTALTTIAGTAT